MGRVAGCVVRTSHPGLACLQSAFLGYHCNTVGYLVGPATRAPALVVQACLAWHTSAPPMLRAQSTIGMSVLLAPVVQSATSPACVALLPLGHVSCSDKRPGAVWSARVG